MKRREWILAIALAMAAPAAMAQAKTPIEVWKSQYCGCCTGWVKHLEANGFEVKVHTVDDASVMRRRLGIPDKLGSCHTAKIAGYAIEGHVPASDLRRLLAEKPKARGLSAPGMPAGSPGMDVPGSPPYEVVLVDATGGSTLYSRHTPR